MKNKQIAIYRTIKVRERYISGRRGFRIAEYKQTIKGKCFWWNKDDSRGGMLINPRGFVCDCIEYQNASYCKHYPHDNKVWFQRTEVIQ